MKKVYIMLITTLFIAGCSTPSGKYEQAIADYVQTDKGGTWTDLQFKSLETEVSERTVADSIAILRADFEAEKNKNIESERKNRDYWQGQLTDKTSAGTAALYRSKIAVIDGRIDSIQNLNNDATLQYEGLSTDKVLAIAVKCHYSYVMPGKEVKQERTETFLLSFDGKTVLGKEK